METVEKRLIIALDFPTWNEAEEIVRKLPEVSLFKVGLELYLASRGEAVQQLRKLGKDVFLDLKFHDILNTVTQASRQAVRQGAAIFNVHASGGREMMRQAALATGETARELGVPKPLLIAVTVLTSMNEEDLKGIGITDHASEVVTRLAVLTRDAGLDGVVASPQEIGLIRKVCGPDFKIICPGVRPDWAGAEDQKRFLTPREAIESGADYLVIGRPVTRAENPQEAAGRIISEMKEGFGQRWGKGREKEGMK